MHVHQVHLALHSPSQHSLVVVVNAQATTDVEVLEVKALVTDLLDEVAHDDGSVPEDVDLGDGGAQVAVHAHQLNRGGGADVVQEPLQAAGEGRGVSARHGSSTAERE